MLEFVKRLFGAGSKVNMQELVARGAVIVDVRTEREFRAGHVKGSINIPLERLSRNIQKLKKDKPVITCCASGMRSATARNILQNSGFTEVYNGGSWLRVQNQVS